MGSLVKFPSVGWVCGGGVWLQFRCGTGGVFSGGGDLFGGGSSVAHGCTQLFCVCEIPVRLLDWRCRAAARSRLQRKGLAAAVKLPGTRRFLVGDEASNYGAPKAKSADMSRGGCHGDH